MNLRTQLTLSFALVALLGVGGTGALLITTSYRLALRRVQREQLLLAENRASAISAEIAAEVERLQHLSQLTELNLTDANREPEREILRHARSLPRYFTLETSAVSPEGTVLWTEPPPPQERSVKGERWFAEAQEKHASFVTEEPGNDGHATRARLVVPLWLEDGRFGGCLTSTIDPATASRWSSHLALDLGKNGTAILADRDGRSVATRGAPEGERLPEEAKALRSALGGTVATAWGDDAKGRRWLFTAVPLPNMGWALLTRQDANELDDTLDPELRLLGLLLCIGVAGALVMGVFYSRAVAGPIQALARTAREVERGKFEVVPPPRRGGELGDLERAFFAMTATLDARVRERTQALEAAQTQLMEQGRFAAMGKTAAAIAHELKNALNGLGVAVELLLQGRLSAGSEAAIREQVRSEIARLRDITDNLNIFAGTPRLAIAPQDLRTLIDRAALTLADRIEASGAALKIEWPEGLPAVPCDGQKIQGVLVNLLKNAVEAVEPQLDTSDTETGMITIAARQVDGAMEVEVADSGPGIAGEVATRMFEPFFTTKRTGTGLGLAIGKRIAEAHGGSLSYTPNVPHGARLVLRLPLQPSGEP